MRIIDTHSHIYSEEFDEDINDVIARAKSSGVEKILLPNIDTSSLERLYKLQALYPDYCIPMMGLHPTSIDADWQNQLRVIRNQLETQSFIAVGEIGIDLYWDRTYEREQRLAFEEQLQWSIQFNLPVTIHSRDAIPECIACIKNVGEGKLRGVFHSFSGTEDELYSILALKNFMLGINGVVTFKNSILPQVLKQTDLSHIIIETDAPYLAPVPYRGKRNEPSYTLQVAKKLAEIYDTDIEQVGKITTLNAKNIFQIL